MPGTFFFLLAFALLAAYVTAHACIHGKALVEGVHGSRVSGPVAAMDGLEHVVPVEAVAVAEEAVAVCSVQFCPSLVALDATLLYIQKAPRLPPSLVNPLSFPFSSATHLVLRLLLIPFFLPLFSLLQLQLSFSTGLWPIPFLSLVDFLRTPCFHSLLPV